MALPSTVVSVAAMPGYSPPYKSSGGSYFVVAKIGGGQNCSVYKADSDDPTGTWTEQDTSNRPSLTTSVISTTRTGDLIHIALYDAGTYKYALFDMASSTWQDVGGAATQQVIETISGTPANPWISIAVRSNGEVVAVYAGATDRVMGGDKERADYNIRSAGGSWGGPVSLVPTGEDNHFGNPNCVKASDNDSIHILWSQTATLTVDPPTQWEQTAGRTLSAANALSTTVVSGIDTGAALLGVGNGVSFNNGTDELVDFCTSNPGASGAVFRLKEDGSGNVALQSPVTGDFTSTGTNASATYYGVCAIVELGGVVYAIWVDNQNTSDLYYNTSTDGGLTWGTAALAASIGTGAHPYANVYQRGTNLVLAFVYGDGSATLYDEVVLTIPSMTALSDGSLSGLINSHVGPFEV